MPEMNISRVVQIDAPAEKIYKVINDFNNWKPWSPWLIMEPEARVTVADDSKSYEWVGKRVGSGNMKVLREEENKSIEFDLNFLKPWKSSAKTGFTLVREGNATKLTWTMNSRLPFFMFFMKKMMEAYVGADYERGLDMLKAYVEKGEVPSMLEFKGFSEFEGCKWIGINRACNIKDIEMKMIEDFGAIWEYSKKNENNIAGETLTIYHKWDLVKNKVRYTAAIQIKNIPSVLPSGFVSGSIPASKVYILRHVGRYQHLGNAWNTLYTMNRNKELKAKKGIHPFEMYLNNPNETPGKELITELYFAVK